MIPPERRDTTNVRPDEYAKRDASRPGPVQREFNRNDYVAVVSPPAPVSVPKLTPARIRASALPSSRKQEAPAPEPRQLVEQRERNQLQSGANTQRLENAIRAAVSERVKNLMQKRQVVSLMGALSPNQAIGDTLSQKMMDAYSARVFAQVDSLVRIGMDRQIALQRMLDKVNNGSFWIMADQLQNLSKLWRWGIGLLLAYWIFF